MYHNGEEEFVMEAIARKYEQVTLIRKLMVYWALAYYLVILIILLAVPGTGRVALALFVVPLFALGIAISYTPLIKRPDIKEALAGGAKKTADQIIAEVLAKKGVTLGGWRSALIWYQANRDYIDELQKHGELEAEIISFEGQPAQAFTWSE